jgi:hydroxyethylthiazole kinase-like uncharacterized protein yjeF
VIRRVGIDICSVERMATAVRRSGQGFLDKVFTPAELAYCDGDSERLAGRWAAKEAVIKCFDATPICFPRRKIEVLGGPNGAPRVGLRGDAQGARIELSITHQAGIAVATAVLEMPSPEESLLPPPEAVTIPARPAEGHKGTFGQVVVVAGSEGYTGAPYLSATAAARAGAGTVRLVAVRAIYPILAAKCAEVIVAPVPDGAPGAFGPASYEPTMRYLEAGSSGVLGPGLGRDPATVQLVHDVVAAARLPLVVDADALNALAEDRRRLAELRQGGRVRILTPHPGEMSRLLGSSTADVQRDRPESALGAARRWGAIVVLKGAHTVVAAPDGRVEVDPHAVPALATGGTGDVLAGLIAGLLAQGSGPFEAAVTGVYVHGAAGRRMAATLGLSGLLAGDLLPVIPILMQELRGAGK